MNPGYDNESPIRSHGTEEGENPLRRELNSTQMAREKIGARIGAVRDELQREMERLANDADVLRDIATAKEMTANDIREFLYPNETDRDACAPTEDGSYKRQPKP